MCDKCMSLVSCEWGRIVAAIGGVTCCVPLIDIRIEFVCTVAVCQIQ